MHGVCSSRVSSVGDESIGGGGGQMYRGSMRAFPLHSLSLLSNANSLCLSRTKSSSSTRGDFIVLALPWSSWLDSGSDLVADRWARGRCLAGGEDRRLLGEENSLPEPTSMSEVLSDIRRSLSGSPLRLPMSDFLRMDLERRWCSTVELVRLSTESIDREDLLPPFLPETTLSFVYIRMIGVIMVLVVYSHSSSTLTVQVWLWLKSAQNPWGELTRLC